MRMVKMNKFSYFIFTIQFKITRTRGQINKDILTMKFVWFK